MVDKPLQFPDNPLLQNQQFEPQEVEIEPADQDAADLLGSSEPDQATVPQQFDDNLALHHVDESELGRLANELLVAIDEDKRGRQDWEQAYKDGLDYLGIKEQKKDIPWDGCCGTAHPMILEAVVRYQSRAQVKLFPSDGPVKLSVDSDQFQQNSSQIQIELGKAQRKYNRYLLEKMPELRDDTDRLLFSQAEIGWAAKKVYYDDKLGRVTSRFVPAEHLIIPYGYPNLETCPRFTEVMRVEKAIVESRQRRKLYRDVPIGSPVQTIEEIDKAKSDLIGQEPSAVLDDVIQLYEVHADLHIESDQFGSQDGDTSPYIVVIEDYTGQILSIRRGWRQGDTLRRKRGVFIPYPFVPADGSYSYGYIHLIGQIAISTTKILRQLVDAGTLSNLPGGFKTKMARMNSQEAIAPAEWRDVDIDPENLSKSFMPLPYKEPSQTLFALMQGMIEEGKNFSSTADLDISASSQNAPVGTTLALLERQTEVSNAIQSRLHDSFRRELSLITELLAEYQPDVYQGIFAQLEGLAGGPASIYPVGDPTSATLSQRIIQLQSVLQLSAQAPQVFNLPALFRTALTAMGVDDVETLVPDTTQQTPQDPVSETMAMLTGKPVQAFQEQDHDAHLTVHRSVATDPYFQQALAQNPQAMAIMAANEAHIAQHLGFQFRQQVQQQLGVQLPPLGQLPPQIENIISGLVAQAVPRVVANHAQQAQQQQAQQQMQDPAYQLEQQNLALKQRDIAQKGQLGMAKLQLEAQRGAEKDQIERMRIAAQERQATQSNLTKIAADRAGHQREVVGTVVDIGKALLAHKAKADASALQHDAATHAAELQHEAAMQNNNQETTSSE